MPVKPAREQALARAGLALDENGTRRGEYTARTVGELSNRRTLAEERVDRASRLAGLPGQAELAIAAIHEQAVHDRAQDRKIRRLREERDILAKATAWFARGTDSKSKKSSSS